jgi:hypothetical protein
MDGTYLGEGYIKLCNMETGDIFDVVKTLLICIDESKKYEILDMVYTGEEGVC